jgi:hypothetical protein
MARSNAEWRELMERLEALIANPNETKERRAKAQKILDGIVRPISSAPQIQARDRRDTRIAKTATESTYDGKIV